MKAIFGIKKILTKLKLADIFKKLENIFVQNYIPVSVLPVVSKIFERIMRTQTNDFVENTYCSQSCWRALCSIELIFSAMF